MRLIIKRRPVDGERPSTLGEREQLCGEVDANGVENKQTVHLLPYKIHPVKASGGSHTLTAPVDRYFHLYAASVGSES